MDDKRIFEEEHMQIVPGGIVVYGDPIGRGSGISCGVTPACVGTFGAGIGQGWGGRGLLFLLPLIAFLQGCDQLSRVKPGRWARHVTTDSIVIDMDKESIIRSDSVVRVWWRAKYTKPRQATISGREIWYQDLLYLTTIDCDRRLLRYDDGIGYEMGGDPFPAMEVMKTSWITVAPGTAAEQYLRRAC
jgi:hypothetical protein